MAIAPSRRVEDAKVWFESRLRHWVSQARGQARGEPDVSGLDVVKLHEEGRYRDAEVAARRLVESLRQTKGERHPHYATALSNLALSLQKQGDRAAAEPLLRQVLDIRREALGDKHPHYATALNNLALLLCEEGDLEAAEPLLRQALDIRREALGDRHPDHATGLTSLAMLLCERGDLDGAEPMLRQALEIRRETLGESHPQYATSLNNLALLLRERGDAAGADPLLRQAFSIRRKTLGDQHPDTQACEYALESIAPTTEADLADPIPGDELPGGSPAAETPVVGAQAGRDAESLREEWNGLVERFGRVHEPLAAAAERMGSAGLPPDEAVLAEAAACARAFAHFRAEVFRLAESAGVTGLADPDTSGLPELSALLDITAETQGARRRFDAVRAPALELIERALALTSGGGGYDEILGGIRAQADAVRQAVEASAPHQLHPDVERLAAGEHPLGALVQLARGAPEYDDAQWTELFDRVSDAFGKPAAVAIVRGRITLPGG